MPVIKVCGIQNAEEAAGAIAAGANTLGFLMGLTHLAEDKISPEKATAIVRELPEHIRSVMVTHLLDENDIGAMAREVGVKAVQIHDDLPVDRVRKLRLILPNVELIKAIHVTGADALVKAHEYAESVDMLLLDSRTKTRLGGTGQTHDWNISREIVRAVNIPVILAGGLNPQNVAEAIKSVDPAGIDANSGLEKKDGSKDFEKIRVFAKIGQLCKFDI
jgi:phosphoribosylanthranilate isomerase